MGTFLLAAGSFSPKAWYLYQNSDFKIIGLCNNVLCAEFQFGGLGQMALTWGLILPSGDIWQCLRMLDYHDWEETLMEPWGGAKGSAQCMKSPSQQNYLAQNARRVKTEKPCFRDHPEFVAALPLTSTQRACKSLHKIKIIITTAVA